ncbi:MAG: TetR/AcrR family transcriptional regulator [Anaerolineales bacterium]|nr:TetR/AcrR family transcriptional regulator [Anaerolineales bacterium]
MSKSNNAEREQRILDVAAELFVHYGYDKTTVSDIAQAAGISKGAIYLHYSSKEALLENLLGREMKQYAFRWMSMIEADPQGGTLGGMYKNMLYALNDSTFLAAMFKRDERVLGSYLRQPNNFFQNPSRIQANRYEFVKMMQEAGAVRQDMDANVVAYIMNLLLYGLVAMGDIMPAEDIPPLDHVIEGIADIMDRALTPATSDSSEAGKQVFQQIVAARLQQYEAKETATAEETNND